MKTWITLFVCLLFATAVLMAGGCSKKEEPSKPVAEVAKPLEPEKKAEEVKSSEAKPVAQIIETITKFTDAFNVNDLDRVMTFFSDDAVYEPGDGRTHRGKAEIRAAFEPQFNGAYGALRFDVHDLVIDVDNRKAVSRWVSRHDMSQAKSRGLVMALKQMMIRLFAGKRFGWQGVDVFHFDTNGKIKGKFTYGWYGSRPYTQPELG